jgi:gliding motility associated protien GldN
MKTYIIFALAAVTAILVPEVVMSQIGSIVDPPGHTSGRKVVPYPYVREADVMWSKKTWECIDLREKMNQPLYYPLTALSDRESLFDIIRSGVNPVESASVPALAAYSTMDDNFKTTLSRKEVKEIFTREDTVYMPLPDDPTRLVPQLVKTQLSAADIRQYWIMEEWFFDKQRSVLDVRILAIMPVIEKKDEKGEFQGLASTFWISFAELRPLLIQQYAFLRRNSANLLTFDDLFMKRMFSGYIIKEDNPADGMVAEFKGANTIDALLESERIKEGIRNKESDMWQH